MQTRVIIALYFTLVFIFILCFIIVFAEWVCSFQFSFYCIKKFFLIIKSGVFQGQDLRSSE